MGGRLANKRALITAAGQGIGRATTLAYAAEGAHVIASDVNEAALASLADEAALETRRLDVLEGEAIARAAAELGALDALVNCAGWVAHGAILACAEEDWDATFELNVRAMYRVTRAFLPAMIEAGGGAIVNIASVASSLKGVPERCAYGASKAAVIGLTKSVAIDYIRDGIRCNAVCPGTVQTPSLDQRIAARGGTEAARQAFVERQPMGRLGTPEEIAALCVYLASDDSAYMTGAVLTIDGGMTL